MAKKKADIDGEAGEQMDLIDVAPENLKEITAVAKKYKAAGKKRMAASEQEQELKQQILALVKEAHVTRLENGMIRLKCNSMTITITPRDELVKVKGESDEE